jgi:hypothetical protein
MNKTIEPLRQEPEGIPGGSLRATYANGFHDGAYSLAQELLSLRSLHGAGEALSTLESYASKDARPCKGWTCEPSKPQPENRKPFDFTRPGHGDTSYGYKWVEESK